MALQQSRLAFRGEGERIGKVEIQKVTFCNHVCAMAGQTKDSGNNRGMNVLERVVLYVGTQSCSCLRFRGKIECSGRK